MRKRFFIPIIITAAIFLLSLIGYITILFLGDYVIDEKKLIFHASSKIVDQNGEEVASLYTENRRPVSIAEVPDGVKMPLSRLKTSAFMSTTASILNR